MWDNKLKFYHQNHNINLGTAIVDFDADSNPSYAIPESNYTHNQSLNATNYNYNVLRTVPNKQKSPNYIITEFQSNYQPEH